MFSFVKTEILEDRLDAEFYSEDQIHNLKKLNAVGTLPLKDLCKSVNVGYTGELTSVYTENGVALFRVSDIEEVFLNDSSVNYIPEDFAKDNPNIWIKDNDIVLAAVGNTIGKVAIKSPSLPDGVCSRALMIARPIITKINPFFLISYLACQFAQKSLIRGVSGSAQPVLNTPLIANLPVIKVNIIAQKYIGDKVHQAELLREWAKNFQNKATKSLPVFKNCIADYKENYFKSNKIFSERLDSQFYHPNHIALDNELKLNNCVKLSHFAKLIKQNWSKDKAQEFLYFEIGGLNINTGLIQPECLNVNDAPSRAKTKVRYADILVSTVRPNRKNVGFIAIDESTIEMVATSGFSVLRFEKPEIAAFYHFWLRSDDATSQLMRWNSGSAYPAIDDDVPLNILVPKFEQHLIDEWGKKLLFAQLSYIYAQKLVSFAKFIVEALIEGVITEEELIQVQNALEQGDTTLDRTILSQMTEDGYAVAGSKPLFSDLDEFYDLLEQAKALE